MNKLVANKRMKLEQRIRIHRVRDRIYSTKESATKISLTRKDFSSPLELDEIIHYITETKQNVTKLDLSSCRILADGAKALAEILKTNTTLREINLWGNNIGNEGVIKLAGALRENKTLTKLNLGWNNIDDAGAKALAEALRENNTLQKLNLSGNNIEDVGFLALAEAAIENPKFDLFDNHTSIEIVKTLVNKITGNTTSIEGKEKYQQILKEYLNKVTSLDFRGKYIGDEGATAIANALGDNITLTELDLRLNKISAVGAEKLAEVLKGNLTLQKIDLSGNMIGDRGAEALAKMLKTNTILRELDLRQNKITDKGATALAEAAIENPNLDLFDDETSAKIVKTLLNKKNFLVFVVTNQSGVARNFYSENDVKKLHRWMKNILKEKNAIINEYIFRGRVIFLKILNLERPSEFAS